MTLINPYIFGGGGGGGATWNATVAATSPWAWWKLDDDTADTVVDDASGNSRVGAFRTTTAPIRQDPAIVTGSTYAVEVDSTDWCLRDNTANFVANLTTSSSFTFGLAIQTTGTTTAPIPRLVQSASGFTGLAIFANYPASGDLRFYYDSGGSDADSLLASGCGWNDGSPHLIFFEYDNTANTMSIWKDGVEIATRTRAGTKPGLSTQFDWLFRSGTALAGTIADEYLFYNRVLTSTEHSDLAAFV